MGQPPAAGGSTGASWSDALPGAVSPPAEPLPRAVSLPRVRVGWPAGNPTPSGLFPGGPMQMGSVRPTYREPHPVRGGALAAGAAVTAVWLVFIGLLGRQLTGYVWYTVLAGGIAWLVALLLARYGDRGAAAGIAMVTAIGWSAAVVAVAMRWSETGDWPLW